MNIQKRNKVDTPVVSILVSDLSSVGSGRWGLDSGDRPFMISKALNHIGYTSEIIGLGDVDYSNTQENSSIQIIRREGGRKIWASFQKAISAIKGDIVYAYKPKVTSFGLGLLAKLQKRRVVFLDIDDWELSWHGGDSFQYRPSLKQFGRDILKTEGSLRNPEHPTYLQGMQKLIPLADKITTHNSFLQSRFGGIMLPNCKDIHLFDPSHHSPSRNREELGLSEFKILMFPGAPRPYKGVEDVLEALNLIDDPLLKLVVIGGSPYDSYDNYLQEKWRDRLIKLPVVSYRDMPRYISAAHVLIVPQRDTPVTRAQFPLKITDGMAMAKPVLATRVGDIPSILSNTGYLVEPEKPEQLAKSILEIFGNYEQALATGAEARKRCVEEYSFERMQKTLHEIFS